MMTVEEKPDVTYADIGGSKEQIEKIREVVELPLLHVCFFYFSNLIFLLSLKDMFNLVLTLQKVFCYMDLRVQEKLCKKLKDETRNNQFFVGLLCGLIMN